MNWIRSAPSTPEAGGARRQSLPPREGARLNAVRLAAETVMIATATSLLFRSTFWLVQLPPGRLAAITPLIIAGSSLGAVAVAWRGLATKRERAMPRDRQVTVSTAAALLVITVIVLVFGVEHRPADAVDLVLGLVCTLAFWVREIGRWILQNRLIRQLAEQALTDPLTGLGNRRALASALADRYAPPPRPVSILTLDLDNFKAVNTLLGHHIGDALLAAVARDLERHCAGRQASAFRLGGDEFAVLVDGAPEVAETLAEAVVESIPRVAAGIPGAGQVAVSGSVGIAHRPATVEGDDPGLLDLIHSGDAMRAAKAAGRSRVLAYGTPMARQQNRHNTLERRLQLAIAEGGITLHFQPIISLPEMKMVGVESLARWEDDELGFVSPVEFIPVAEDCGLIEELGMQVLQQSMEWSIQTGAHANGLVTGVNVSATQLRLPGFAAWVSALIDETGVIPKQFAIEITESVQIEESDPAVATIWQLAELGLPIALDDFGTGYSSLSLISRLPIRILKLDRSITQRLGEPRGLAIARCVSEMAGALDVDVVAEGIETVDDLTQVRNLQIGFGQGWLFSRAVTAQRLAELVLDPHLALGSRLDVTAGRPA